jgi:hypothetical protein
LGDRSYGVDVTQCTVGLVNFFIFLIGNGKTPFSVVPENKSVSEQAEPCASGIRVIGILEQFVDEVCLIGIFIDNPGLEAFHGWIF